MHLPSFFGLGARRIIELDRHTVGTVTDVSTCWWFKVNTKPIRRSMWDGAVYPHIVRFSYSVDGVQYSASRFLNWQNSPPAVGQGFRLYYDPAKPERFAIPAF